MTLPDLIALLPQYGQMGVFIAYLLWRDGQQAKATDKRVAADLEMAQAITLLSARMEGLRHVP
jgi:hypothetical protein